MRRVLLGSVVVAVAVGGCSLFTTFPEVEREPTSSSTGDTSSNGSTGTDMMSSSASGGCVLKPNDGCRTVCDPTFTYCEPAAPTFEDQVVITAPGVVSTFTPSIVLTDATLDSNGQPLFVGSFYGDNVTELGGTGTTKITGTSSGNGIVLRENGAPVLAISPCDLAPGVGPETIGELVLTGIAAQADGGFAITGGFVAPQIVGHTGMMTCNSNAIYSHLEGKLTPFIWWFTAAALPKPGLEPAMGAQMGDAIFTDMVRLTDATVAAVGVSAGAAFPAQDQNAASQFFVATAAGASDDSVHTLEHAPCPTTEINFSDQDVSVAVGPLNGGFPELWVAGTTGCTSAGTGRGFIERWRTVAPVTPDIAYAIDSTVDSFDYGGTGNMRILDIELDDDSVVIAGVYSGTIDIVLAADMSPIPEGNPDKGDIFVARFPLAGFNNQTPATWFQRFANGDPTKAPDVTDLRLDGPRVFVSGRMPAEVSVGDPFICGDDGFPSGRGFVAQLDGTTGALGWLRIDGAQPGTPMGNRTAFTSVVLPTLSGELYSSVATTGEVVVECSKGSTPASKPAATILHHSLPAPP